MTFRLNHNVPAGPIVCGTNLRPEFFEKAGIQSLPEGLGVHVGYKHGEPATFHISDNGKVIESVGKEAVVPALLRNGAQRTPAGACGC